VNHPAITNFDHWISHQGRHTVSERPTAGKIDDDRCDQHLGVELPVLVVPDEEQVEDGAALDDVLERWSDLAVE
jgi:hypothetical protein